MLGLIKKDLLLIKSNIKMVIIMFVVFILLAINGNGNFSFIPAFISVMLFMSTFSYDEYNKWDAYAITLPNGRKNVVKSKYIATLILIFLSVLVTLITCIIVGYINQNFEMKGIIETLLGCALAVILIQSFMYPFIFKFGIEKSRIGIFIVVFSLTFIISLISKQEIKISSNLIQFFNIYGMILISVLTLIILLVSYKMSRKIYLNKEF